MTLAAVFPGQGSQSVGMGHELLEQYSEVSIQLERADEICGYSLSALMKDGPRELLDKTVNAQPAIYLANHILWRLVRKTDIKPDFVAGHSLGELSACLAADMFSFEVGLEIVIHRAQLMSDAAAEFDGGMMAVIGLADLKVIKVSEEVGLEAVNFNCPGQVVVAGLKKDIESSKDTFKDAGARKVVQLAVSGAFHSSAMVMAARKFSEYLADKRFEEPRIPIISNETAKPLLEAEDVKAALARQLANPVRWRQCVEAMIEMGVDKFIEIGSGKVLTGLIKRISSEVAVKHAFDKLCA
ncbi:MAG TPA: [acyl-carrier-protein] S-malonyltransferase [Actinobacteria bacterium]|nr:[acyl-carrier-protein] S-malonyltransferase [Actinomycetota bacterium]